MTEEQIRLYAILRTEKDLAKLNKKVKNIKDAYYEGLVKGLLTAQGWIRKDDCEVIETSKEDEIPIGYKPKEEYIKAIIRKRTKE